MWGGKHEEVGKGRTQREGRRGAGGVIVMGREGKEGREGEHEGEGNDETRKGEREIKRVGVNKVIKGKK